MGKVNFKNMDNSIMFKLDSYYEKSDIIEHVRKNLQDVIKTLNAKAGLVVLFDVNKHKHIVELFLNKKGEEIQHSIDELIYPLGGKSSPDKKEDFFGLYFLDKLPKELEKYKDINIIISKKIMYFPVMVNQNKLTPKVGEIIIFTDNDDLLPEQINKCRDNFERIFLILANFYHNKRMNKKVLQLKYLADFAKSIEKIDNKEELLYAIEKAGSKEYKNVYNSKSTFIIRLVEGNNLVLANPKGNKIFPKDFSVDEPLFKKVLKDKKTIVIDPETDNGFIKIKNTFQNNTEHSRYVSILKKIKSLIIAPFIVNNKVIGIFSIYEESRTLGESEMRFFDDLASISSLSFKKLDAYEDAKKEALETSKKSKERLRRLALLRDLTRKIVAAQDYNKLLKIILEGGLRLVGSTSGNIRIYDKETETLTKVCSTKDPLDGNVEIIKIGEGVCGKVIKLRKALRLRDVYAYESWRSLLKKTKGEEEFNRLIKEKRLMHSEVSAPLKVGNEIIGTIDAHKLEIDAFSKDDLEIFEDLAILSAIALKNKRLKEQFDMVRNIAEKHADMKNIDIDKTLKDVLINTLKIIGVNKGVIALQEFNDEQNILKYFAVEKIFNLEKEGYRKFGEGLMGKVAENKKGIIFNDVRMYKEHKNIDENIISEMIAPMMFNGKLKGVIMVAATIINRFSEIELDILEAIANQLAIFVHNVQLLKEKEEHYNRMEKETIQHMINMSGLMAHSLKTPLQIIKSAVEVVEKKIQHISSKRKNVALVNEIKNIIPNNIKDAKNGVSSLDSIIQHVLTFALTMELELSDIHTVLDETIDYIRTLKTSSQGNIKIEKKYAEIPKVSFNSFQMRLVCMNIINNAYEAMKTKGGNLIVSTEKKDNYLEISFQDDGVGISESNKEEIFKSFFTTKKNDGGTGLGLAISKRFIEKRHGGKINFESAEDQTKFIITIPIK